MRVLALFFAFYFAVLGCLPCVDEQPCAEQTHAAFVQTAHQDYGRQQDLGDWCSPLCQCHCCAGFALPTVVAVLFAGQPVRVYPTVRFAAEAVLALPARAPATLWQPPQAA